MTNVQPEAGDQLEVEPPVVTDMSGMSVERVWSFLEDSGFIYPQKRQMIDPDSAKATLAKLMHKNNVFKGLVVTRGSSIYAHLSAVRVYDKVWMVQHMASRPYKKEKVSHALMLNLAMLEYFEQSSDIEWIRATYRHENKRVSRLYEAMAAQVSRPGLSLTQYLNCMRLSDHTFEVPVSNYLEVRVLPNDGLSVLGGNRFECFKGLSVDYENVGLERRQEFLGVYHLGMLVGYSVLEISSPGLNLSELTNAFRVFMFEDDPGALSYLIQVSTNYYKSLGRQQVIALVEDDLAPSLEALGFERFKRYTFWTWHQSLCRQFHDFISNWQ
jgi:hypothetical protein